MKRIETRNDGYWLWVYNTDDNAKDQLLKVYSSPNVGKYLIFCDNFKLLQELCEFLLIKFDLSNGKLSLNNTTKSPGFGHVLCVYDYECRLKEEIHNAIYEFYPATHKTVTEGTYPFNYRYWKSDKQIIAEAKSGMSQKEKFNRDTKPKTKLDSLKRVSKRIKSAKNDENFIVISEVVFTERGLEKGIDVFARSFKNEMNNKMMEDHPEIFNAEWEEDIDSFGR